MVTSLLLFLLQLIVFALLEIYAADHSLRPRLFHVEQKREENPKLPQFSTKIATWEPTTSSWRPASRIHFKLSCISRHIIAGIY